MSRIKDWLTQVNTFYQEEDSYFQHEGKNYSLNDLFARTRLIPAKSMSVKNLEWIIPYGNPDPERVAKANTDIPIIIMRWNDKWVVVDGYHRLVKAKRYGHSRIKTKEIKFDWLKEIP